MTAKLPDSCACILKCSTHEAAGKLLHEAKYALALLQDLEASANPATDPKNPQAAAFWIALSGLERAVEWAEGR